MPRGETYRGVHYDRPLSDFSVAYFQDTTNFVCNRFFNTIPVNHASDKYTVYPRGYFNRVHDTKRAEEAKANSISYKTKEENYNIEVDALRIFISDQKRANVDVQRMLDLEATEAVNNALMIRKEKDFADTFLKSTSGWTTTTDVYWSGTNGDPVKEVLNAKVAMTKLTGGYEPNRGIISYDLFVELRERADILERVQYGGGVGNEKPAMISVNALAALFELDELLVMKSVYNQAVDGIEDGNGDPPEDNVFMASEFFFMAHVAPTVGLMTPTAGSTFVWNRYLNHGPNAGPATRRYRESEAIKGEYIETEMAIEQKMVSPDLGVLFHEALTSD